MAPARVTLPQLGFNLTTWPICTVPILIVTDSPAGGYGDELEFHLGHLLKILADTPLPHISFRVTTAHREDVAGADITRFRFDAHDLSQFSQIWLFGIEREFHPLEPAELRALATFMNNGGGLFATGDHENMGKGLSGAIPRVRSMRRWFYPDAGPNSEPVAPSQTGPDRHDTITDADPRTPEREGTQEDKVPQTIRPRWYQRRIGIGLFHRVEAFPHPVLCGPAGPIVFLPDHMHEGQCEVPGDLTRTYTFESLTGDEYPSVDGWREAPEVIAWATSKETSTVEFGVLAAYDGHRVDVGRVLVDSTWHHWFNVNLKGFLAATDPQSPDYDPAVVPQFEAIKAYYRNVPLFLASKGLQACFRLCAWLLLTRYTDILITRRPLREKESLDRRLIYYWQLGDFARTGLRRLGGSCTSIRWIASLIDWAAMQVDPWTPANDAAPPPWLDLREMETVALGGAVHALCEAVPLSGPLPDLSPDAAVSLHATARRGAALAGHDFAVYYENTADPIAQLRRLADAAR
jgi:hypothetical protein